MKLRTKIIGTVIILIVCVCIMIDYYEKYLAIPECQYFHVEVDETSASVVCDDGKVNHG